jgi:Sulfotransferase family
MPAPSTTTAPSSDADPERPKVIYLMGSGRSGSTILGVTLGNCEGIFYAGELDTWLARSGAPVLGGRERTRFWSLVANGVAGAQELFDEDIRLYIERSSAALRIDRWPTRRRLRGRYRRVTEELYRSIARAAGASHVVDTSHFPLRARELQRIPGIDLYLVFLFRDPRAVVASFTRLVRRQDVAERRLLELTTNANLWITHMLSVLVFLRQRRDQRMLVHHEDFLADPEAVLRDILRRVDSPAEIPDLATLKTGFPLKGNRLIRSDVIAVKQRAPSPPRRSPLTSLLHLPWTFAVSRLKPVARGFGRAKERAPGELRAEAQSQEVGEEGLDPGPEQRPDDGARGRHEQHAR